MYIHLFWNFFKIGLFSFGGGYAVLPLIQEYIIENNGWLTLKEYADLVALSQMTPGPIGINAATFVGIKVEGFLGGVVATIGCVTPSFCIVIVLAILYYKYRNLKVLQGILKGIRPAVVALIATAAISIVTLSLWGENDISFATIDWTALCIFVIAFLFLRIKKNCNTIVIMLASGILGLFSYYLHGII